MTPDCMDDRPDSVSGRSGALGAESMEKDKAVGVDNGDRVGPSSEVTPPCRVCGKSEPVLCYDPKHPENAICPDCCDKVEEHPLDGERGHVWEYDRYEREHACGHCGIFRRDTNYDYSEDYEP